MTARLRFRVERLADLAGIVLAVVLLLASL